MSSTPSNLGFALLGLLHERPQSGYDLRKVFAETALGNYSSSPGAIYPALKRLEEQGLIEGEVDSTKALRPRKVFRLTGSGKRSLVEWLSGEIELEDVARRLDELMLRFAFHAILDSDQATLRFLGQLSRECTRYVTELESQREVFPAGTPIQSRLALEAGIEHYRATAGWAQKAVEHFKER